MFTLLEIFLGLLPLIQTTKWFCSWIHQDVTFFSHVAFFSILEHSHRSFNIGSLLIVTLHWEWQRIREINGVNLTTLPFFVFVLFGIPSGWIFHIILMKLSYFPTFFPFCILAGFHTLTKLIFSSDMTNLLFNPQFHFQLLFFISVSYILSLYKVCFFKRNMPF